MKTLTILQKKYDLEKDWVCQVLRTGYHNGATCDKTDPHDDHWGCGYRYELSLTPAEFKQLKEDLDKQDKK